MPWFRRISFSLTSRLLFFAALLVLLGTGVRYFMLAEILRDDLATLVSAQQSALANEVAKAVDEKIVMRKQFLAELGHILPPALLDRPQDLQAWLAERYRLNPLFTLGLILATPDGRILAEYPSISGRASQSLASQPEFQRLVANNKGEVVIGKPRMGPFSGQAALSMGMTLRNPAGNVRAVLIGITGLNAPNFLDTVTHGRVGQTGSYLLISPEEKVFVAAGDPKMVLAPTPPAGLNPLHDRAMAGFRGSGLTVNAFGVEELSSMVSVPSTGWFVVARMPTEEAYAPIRHSQAVLMRMTLLVVIGVTLIAGYFIRRTFRPLKHAAELAEKMTHGEQALAPLPIVYNDEVGHLTGAFNALIDKLAASQIELQHMAHHDELTGLPNRILLAEHLRHELARARRKSTLVALFYMDLDGFKPINDELGHDQGDQALIEVARRLSAAVRESDTLARIGGDEFILLAADLEQDPTLAAKALASKCLEAMRPPFLLSGKACQIGLSIGVALGNGHDSPDSLIQRADQAMYAAKNAGKSTYAFAD